MNRTAESGLEVKLPTDPEIAAPPHGNKYYAEADSGHFNHTPQNQPIQSKSYYTGVRAPNYPVFAQPDLINLGAKSISRHKAFWALAVSTVVCLAVALGAGLGVGLAAQHKPSSTGHAATISTSNVPATVTQTSDITTIIPTPTALSSLSCPAANGFTYTATNKPPMTDPHQMPQNSFSFEILCNTNTGQGGDIRDMQLINNVTSLTDCIDACALFDFQTKTENFPAFACTGVAWGHGLNLDPVHVCYLKSNVTLGSPNNTVTWPGYHGAVLIDT